MKVRSEKQGEKEKGIKENDMKNRKFYLSSKISQSLIGAFLFFILCSLPFTLPFGLRTLHFSPCPLLNAFDEFPIGARPAALSGAFAGRADDVHCLYYNPGGLPNIKSPEITAYYAKLFPGLSDQTNSGLTFMGYVQPIKKDADWGVGGVGFTEFRVEDLFRERTISFSYGRRLGIDKFILNKLSVGLTLKTLERKFGENADTQNAFIGNNPSNRTGLIDPVFRNGRTARALGMDVGAFYRYSKKLSLGLTLANWNHPDVGLVQEDKVPMVTRIGASYKAPFLTATVDLTRRHFLDKTPDHRLLMGAERSWLMSRYGELSVRGGVGIGNRDFRQITMGMGYEMNGIIFDYVFHIPMGAMSDTGNSHRLSLSFRFGRAPGTEELDELVKEEREATARAEAALRLAEAEVAFVKEDRDQLLAEMEKLKRHGHVKKSTRKGSLLSAEDKAKAARQRALREYTAAYQAAMRAYSKKTQRGATFAARIEDLNSIIGKYKDKGVNVQNAKSELERVKSSMAQSLTDFQITWDFYKKTVARGIDDTERISLLERMIKKYAKSGVDISVVRNELKMLQGNR